jgi:hypothetical protein
MNNPHAFPAVYPEEMGGGYQTGMTLRDYFAANAMQALLARDHTRFDQDVREAYEIADAMLEARKK